MVNAVVRTRYEVDGKDFETEAEAYKYENDLRARKEIYALLVYTCGLTELKAEKILNNVMRNRNRFMQVFARSEHTGPWDECNFFNKAG